MKTAKNNIRELREQRGMTQVELAEKMGVSESTVNAWEIDQNLPMTNCLIDLADFFGTTIDHVLARSGGPADADAYVQHVLQEAEYVVNVEVGRDRWNAQWFSTSDQARSYISDAIDGELYSVRKLVPVDLLAFLEGHSAELAGYVRAWDVEPAAPAIAAADAHAMRDALVECIAVQRELKEQFVERAIENVETDELDAVKTCLEQASESAAERRRYEHALEALDLYRDVTGIVPWD